MPITNKARSRVVLAVIAGALMWIAAMQIAAAWGWI